MNLFAAMSAESLETAMQWALILLALSLIWLHFRNRGRSGPIAALLFVLFGPSLGVVLMLGWLIGNNRRDPASSELYGLTLPTFSMVMLIVGIVAAIVGATIHGYRIRDELRAYREFGEPGWLGRLRTGVGPSPALTALGLDPTATLEDVERAYRERAKQAHPDRGGSVEEFKRLQVIYEQAKLQASRRRPAQEAQPAATVGDP